MGRAKNTTLTTTPAVVRCVYCRAWYDRTSAENASHTPVCTHRRLKAEGEPTSDRKYVRRGISRALAAGRGLKGKFRPANKGSRAAAVSRSSWVPKIRLTTHRCSRLSGLHRCDECGVTGSGAWKYLHSNRGTVRICVACRSAVLNRSFGHADARNVSVRG